MSIVCNTTITCVGIMADVEDALNQSLIAELMNKACNRLKKNTSLAWDAYFSAQMYHERRACEAWEQVRNAL